MLREKLTNYNLILASASPRRQNFFKQLDVPFTIQIKEVEEIYPSHLKASEITDYLFFNYLFIVLFRFSRARKS